VTVGGKRPLDAELQKLIRQYEHVDKAIDSFYAAADVFVYPTRVETAGLVLIEAARAGIPAITVDAGGCPEIVKDGETGIVVPPCSPELFADAMCNILSANFHAMGEAARRRYSLHHRIDQMASRYLMLFDHMLSESSHCRTMHPCPKIS
jgi:glycosyltransferase involved in cell wall biosynthesis